MSEFAPPVLDSGNRSESDADQHAHGVRLVCRRCSAVFPLTPAWRGCPSCKREFPSVLEVQYDWKTRLVGDGMLTLLQRAREFGDYWKLLPFSKRPSNIDLGQGFTRVVSSRSVGPRLGLKRLIFKIEGGNPTWSFKDRYAAVTVAMAQQFGYAAVAASSTGNAGASLAAFAARFGLRAVVLCPYEASDVLIAQIAAYGAQVIQTDWESRPRLLRHLAEAHGVFPAGLFLDGEVSNPFGVEGYKTIAYELFDQIGGGIDCVVFPSARGNGLYGTWKGFTELVSAGAAINMPKMVAVQPEGANSLPAAVSSQAQEPLIVSQPRSMATSIRENRASVHALNAIYSSRGTAVAVSDSRIQDAARALANEGILVELASAAPVAALPELLRSNLLDPDMTIVCVLTAAGIKWPRDLAGMNPLPVARITGSSDELDHVLSQSGG